MNDLSVPDLTPVGQMVTCPEQPWMTEEELVCFKKWIPKTGHILEFGMGGSTRAFCETGMQHLTSVESDPSWVAALRDDPFLAFFIRKGRLTLHYSDIGPVRPQQCGLPASPPNPAWLRYHQTVWQTLDPEKLDFVFIDGRFRLACACQTLLRCPQKPPMLIHDFSNRPSYHAILAFADIVDRAGTTVVLVQKESPDWKKLALVLQQSQFNPE